MIEAQAFYPPRTLTIVSAAPAAARPVLLSRALARCRILLGVLLTTAVGWAAETAKPAASPAPGGEDKLWRELFDARSLAGWKVTDFAGHGEVKIEDGVLRLEAGLMLTGVSFTNPVPKMNYEVALEAMKIDGSDFFCGLTFPVRDSFCSLIVGGWGGGVLGLSSLDNYDASENETTKYLSFEKNRWYRIRLRVTDTKLEAWLDDDKVIDVAIAGRKISLRPGEIELSAPFGIASYQTTAGLRHLRLRPLAAESKPAPPAAPARP